MRLIDADALLEAAKAALKYETNPVWTYDELQDLITNAPTVQREGWKLVPIEPTDDMCIKAREVTGISANAAHHVFLAMLAAAPTDKE